MRSLTELYRIGVGPSSSHTMGPRTAAETFRKRTADAKHYRVTLYGSLAATGKGHLTGNAVREALAPARVQIIWKPDFAKKRHPNALTIDACDGAKRGVTATFYSIGGGAIEEEGSSGKRAGDVYRISSMKQMLAWARTRGKTIASYVFETEPAIEKYLAKVWRVMRQAIRRGSTASGVLPGVLKLERKASSYHAKANNARSVVRDVTLVFAGALAVAEENASGGIVVTAPTCGAAGVLPSVLSYIAQVNGVTEKKIIEALAVAGMIGNIVKTNASISGAEAGCQAEIGTACAMTAGAAAYLFGGTSRQIEYAAEMGMEHHLGLTCDPVAGLVQIPCIERNAMAAMRALEAAIYALASDGMHRISFDDVVATMKRTGHDLGSAYRETSAGGLALHFTKNGKQSISIGIRKTKRRKRP
ncbi:MAG: L-serine ammonia-lyase [Spirochaetes bacterium]|nr:L-serine ammonia-lyase [Spirochaetota bacterium]